MESTSSEPNVHADDALMERQLGYKQELYRGIHGIGSWAIGFGNASSYLSVLVIFTFILTTGGPGPNVWDFFISFVLNMFVAFSMGEICSAFPQVNLKSDFDASVLIVGCRPEVSTTGVVS